MSDFLNLYKMGIHQRVFLAVGLSLAGLYISAWLYGMVQSPQHYVAMRVAIYVGYLVLLTGLGWVLHIVMRDVKMDARVQLWATIGAVVMAGMWMLASFGGVVRMLVPAVALLFAMRAVFIAALQYKKGVLWLKLVGIAVVIAAFAFIVSIEKLRADEYCFWVGQSVVR